MSVARFSRDRKRQLGQYFTPDDVAAAIVRQLDVTPDLKILEPAFGAGAFIFQVLDSLRPVLPRNEVEAWCEGHLYGCELDEATYDSFRAIWRSKGLGEVPHSLEHCDFFKWLPPGLDRRIATNRKAYFLTRHEYFDLIVGNPPFGGSIDPAIQDDLDAILGSRDGGKIKKETYAFFLVKAVDLLKPGGRLVFICSDTILTIPTMTGLRHWLQKRCSVTISEVPGVFTETKQGMLLLSLKKQGTPSNTIEVFGTSIPITAVNATPNQSWRVNSELARYFTGVTIGQKMIASSGMTIGDNKLFLRAINKNNTIEEAYEFSFGERRITAESEVARARLGKVTQQRLKELSVAEANGATERAVEWRLLASPRRVHLPSEDYKWYNKASSRIVYAEPKWVVFWRQNGEYVYTYKKTGNWYLHGIGGKKYFGREGITWSLIAPRLYARYLPPGYILDSGAPCAFLRPGVDQDELFFILGWALTDLCNDILKRVLNHTRNIQSKDFERLPYPTWVDPLSRARIIDLVKDLLARSRMGEVVSFQSREIVELNEAFQWQDRRTPNLHTTTRVDPKETLF